MLQDNILSGTVYEYTRKNAYCIRVNAFNQIADNSFHTSSNLTSGADIDIEIKYSNPDRRLERSYTD